MVLLVRLRFHHKNGKIKKKSISKLFKIHNQINQKFFKIQNQIRIKFFFSIRKRTDELN